MIGRGEGQDVDAFATVEQFLIRGLDAACQLCVVGLPRSGSRRSAWPLPKSPEDSLNRRRRPDCRLEGRRASQAAIIRGSTLRPIAHRGLEDHPTVKPTAMLEDAMLDLTNRRDIVIDPFLRSGSTLIAADKTGRVCRGVELDPLYVDVIVRRYEVATGSRAIPIETGETFEALAGCRPLEPALA
jgi:DNA modification methylase